MSGKIELDFEVADGITKATLVETYKILKKSNRELIKKHGSEHMMPSITRADFQDTTKILYHLKEVIEYFGGKV